MKRLLDQVDSNTKVTTVVDGDEALQYIRRQGNYTTAVRPDLIFLDLNLPKTDGIEVLRSIKSNELTRSIPVLVLSSSKSPKDIGACYSLGANAFLNKLNDLEQFDEMVNRTTAFWLKAAVLNGRTL